MNKELEVKLHGRVQGVRLRYIVQNKANNSNLNGCVFNRGDGSVEVVVQGNKKDLQNFLTWLQESPGFSNVSGLQYQWRKPSRKFKDFSVIRENSFLVDQAHSFLNLGKSLFARKGGRPKHVAIIPDGNRRWAKSRKVDPSFGHYTSASFQHLRELFEEAQKQGVKYMSLWGFSTENWKRNPREVKALMNLISKALGELREAAHTQKIRFRHLGRKDRLPKSLIGEINKIEKETEKYDNFNVQLCLDYGGQDEIVRAVNSLLKKKIKRVDSDSLRKEMDSGKIPDVDLIIRTSGEKRTSGFMPLHSAYAEFYFSDVHFPDFGIYEFRKALEDYGKRHRRFGGDNKK